MLNVRRFLARALTAIGLLGPRPCAAPLGFLRRRRSTAFWSGAFRPRLRHPGFGYTGLLSFGQSAFFGTGGMFAAYLTTQDELPLCDAVDRSRHGRRGRRPACSSA